MGMGFKFQMEMGMKSLKWEGIDTKNLFPHTSIVVACLSLSACVCVRLSQVTSSTESAKQQDPYPAQKRSQQTANNESANVNHVNRIFRIRTNPPGTCGFMAALHAC